MRFYLEGEATFCHLCLFGSCLLRRSRHTLSYSLASCTTIGGTHVLFLFLRFCFFPADCQVPSFQVKSFFLRIHIHRQVLRIFLLQDCCRGFVAWCRFVRLDRLGSIFGRCVLGCLDCLSWKREERFLCPCFDSFWDKLIFSFPSVFPEHSLVVLPSYVLLFCELKTFFLHPLIFF